jgi:hypothetical protein
VFAVISDKELRQLREDLEQTQQALAAERKENVRLHGWNRRLAAQVRWHEEFLTSGLPAEIARPLQRIHGLRYANAHLRGDVAQLRLQLANRQQVAPWVEPAPVPVPEPALAAVPADADADTQQVPVLAPEQPAERVARLGSWVWATADQIANLQAQHAS